MEFMRKVPTIYIALAVIGIVPNGFLGTASAARLKCSTCTDICCQWGHAKELINAGLGKSSGAEDYVDYFWRRYNDPVPCAEKTLGTRSYRRCAWNAYKR